MKKLFIFDFDGTLFDSVGDVVICFNDALSRNNFPTLTHEEYLERLGGNIDEITSLILKDKNTPENIELVKKTYEKIYANSKKELTVPFPNVKDFLIKLESNDKIIAINSNRKSDSIKYFVDQYFSDINFIKIEGHNTQYPSKPSPYGVKNIIEKANVKKDETVYIGDSQTDIKTAKNAGIDCILVKWGYGNSNDYNDEYVLDVVEDISEINKYF